MVRARAGLARANRNAERRFVVELRGLFAGYHAAVLAAVEAPAKAALAQQRPIVDAKAPTKPTFPGFPAGHTPPLTSKGQRATPERTWTRSSFVEASKAVDDVSRRILPQLAPKVSAAHQRLTKDLLASYDRSMRPIMPVGFDKLPSMVQAQAHVARDESIKYVENAARVYAQQVRAIFDDPEQTQGVRWEDLKADLLDRASVSESRAELIARDQTLKLAGKINMSRQTANGITHYTWSTSLDERVREEHAALEGEVFAWNSPPEPGNPGDDFQCRCVAIPEIDGVQWGAVEVE
jgi:SPP1 gp7 family putative phage head morphogenesis protein